MVELQPSKLNTWVRFPSPAPISKERLKAQVAQLVEHTLGKGEVGSSNLLLGSIFSEVPLLMLIMFDGPEE